MAEIWLSLVVSAHYREIMVNSKSRMSYAVALTSAGFLPAPSMDSRLSFTAKEFVPQGNKRRQRQSSESSHPITKRLPQVEISTTTKLRMSSMPMLMVVASPPSQRLRSPLPLTRPHRVRTVRSSDSVKSVSFHLAEQKTRRSQRNGCVFCLQNGEDVDLAESHVMRHPLTKEIICPVLKEKPCMCPLDISPHMVDACPMSYGVIAGHKRMTISRRAGATPAGRRLATVV